MRWLDVPKGEVGGLVVGDVEVATLSGRQRDQRLFGGSLIVQNHAETNQAVFQCPNMSLTVAIFKIGEL